jgi:hypothetical protein
MKNKALLLALTTASLALGTKAQETTTFGVRAGVNFQNINGKDYNDDDLENKIKTGFHVGVNAEIPVATDFYLQPGVLFTTKGAINKDDEDIRYNLSYIEVPINFLYKPMLGTGKLLLGIGPYIAFGIGGKFKNGDGKEIDLKFENKITQSQAADINTVYARSIDAGGNLLVGYEFSNKFSAQLNAQLGLTKINPEIEGISNDDSKWKNTGFGVSLGYRFN